MNFWNLIGLFWLCVVWVMAGVSIWYLIQARRDYKAFKAKPYLHDYCRVCGCGLGYPEARVLGICSTCIHDKEREQNPPVITMADGIRQDRLDELARRQKQERRWWLS
jgi:hypothetical protein